jgi:mRNA interferase MazF
MATMMSSRPAPQQGEIWDAYLDPTVGHEQSGRRPVLVLSSMAFNALPSSLCVIVPITSQSPGIPLHVSITAEEGGLRNRSFVLCDQMRTISHRRLRRFRGHASRTTLDSVRSVIALILAADDQR